MKDINQLTQLSLFDTYVEVIRSDSVIANRFPQSSFYQFEESLKSNRLSVPYIYIKVPSVSNNSLSIDKRTTIKSFEVNIVVVVDFQARGKVVEYANRIITAIENSITPFTTQGYTRPDIVLDDIDTEYIQDRQVVVAQFIATQQGTVMRQ